ncbi:BTAD domain-containing putative transcriptional regulator [Amycolatopsis jejuensis]|uniref:BTAD domain-containing putative transcriptional regulator n=1 Tax=Amycolatopsis jejuensis TaxID=330084 RepID=UPI0005254614|nr:BTAD domain-containing putative transcriptional regulator [Amycolatopsis jejuensis]
MTSRAVQHIRAILAALFLLAFVVGIPSGLLTLGADPARLIPDRLPDPSPINQWPDRIWASVRWAWITGDLVIWLVVAVAWAGWLALTMSIVAEVIRQTGYGVRAARGLVGRVPRGRWIAGLVAAVLVATSAGTATASIIPSAPVVATAPPWPQVRPAVARDDQTVPYTVVHGDTLWGMAERHLGSGVRYHEIVRLNRALLSDAPDLLEPGWTLQLPQDAAGVPRVAAADGRAIAVEPGDTLSRIAERELGDPDAWPELFDLNVGRTQPDGRALRDPDQLMPGWNLVLPVLRPPQEPVPSAAPPAPGAHRPERPSTPIPQPGPRSNTPTEPAANPSVGISLPTGAFVGLGLAALITVVAITVRLRHRRWYRPGSPPPADPTSAPVVRALRIAHDTATRTPDGTVPPAPPDRTRDLNAIDGAQATVRAVPPLIPLGTSSGQTVALERAGEGGLGLVGPGAHAAVRALVATLLAQIANGDLDATLVIPAADARLLFGNDLNDLVPPQLRVADDLAAALDLLEAETLSRSRAGVSHGLLVAIATPARESDQRMRAVLDNCRQFGLAGVLLGPWRPGSTARVRTDGVVEATNPDRADTLAHARLFTLPEADARDLLMLLRTASSATERSLGRNDEEKQTDQLIAEYDFDQAGMAPASGTTSTSPAFDVPSNQLAADPPDATEVAGREPRLPCAGAATHGSPVPAAEDRTADSPCTKPLHLQVLGRLHLTGAASEPTNLIEVLAPRQREILVYLALHREGCRRESLCAALWPDAPGDRPYNSFHATLSQLRGALRRAHGGEPLDLITRHDGHYRLNHSLVTVDFWQLQETLASTRGGGTSAVIAAVRRVTELYRGDLADNISAEWIESPREALRREVLDAFSTLIRKVRNDDPEQALAFLEQARCLDPYNEAIYRDLMRVQARLGQHDSIPRTLNLLATSLSDLDEHPAPDTIRLADALCLQLKHIGNQRAC